MTNVEKKRISGAGCVLMIIIGASGLENLGIVSKGTTIKVGKLLINNLLSVTD